MEELERKIKRMKDDVDRATERKRRQEELDSKIIEALILEKMQGMGLLKSQVSSAERCPQLLFVCFVVLRKHIRLRLEIKAGWGEVR